MKGVNLPTRSRRWKAAEAAESIHLHKEVRSPRVSQKLDGAWRT